MEVNSLKAGLAKARENQDSISAKYDKLKLEKYDELKLEKYDELKLDYEKLVTTNKKQEPDQFFRECVS